MTDTINASSSDWKQYEKLAFRFFFLYFLILALPLDPKYFGQVFSLPWDRWRYQDVFVLAHYTPRFFGDTPVFGDWGIVFLISGLGAAAWTIWDKGRTKNYNNLYYWIRVIVRYRLAIALLAYGFIKLYPLQAPYPSLSNLNTHYGDFTRWKLFSLSLGIVPNYEAFLGGVEIVSAIFLLFRRTSSVGALIIAIFLGNVFMSNLAYGGGECVYSACLISLALFVLAYDIQRLTRLLVLQLPTSPSRFKPSWPMKWQWYGRVAIKVAFVFFFVVLLGFRSRWGYHHDSYQFPETKGLAAATGLYNVSFFKLGKDTLGYSATDSIRWKDVVFERWATLSVRSNRDVVLDSGNTEKVGVTKDIDKTYELEGSAERSYYNYSTDTVNQVLTLQNKNSYYRNEKWILHYERPDSSRIILSGVNPFNDSVYVVLNRIDKKYLLEEAKHTGRERNLKL